MDYFGSKYVENKNISDLAIPAGSKIQDIEFCDVMFSNCVFSNVEFFNCKFNDCTFNKCNLSLLKTPNTRLHDIVFVDVKARGIDFSESLATIENYEYISLVIQDANMPDAIMCGLRFADLKISDCDLTGALFDASVLKNAVFESCSLQGASFQEADITNMDVSTSLGFVFDIKNQFLKRKGLKISSLDAVKIVEAAGVKVK